MQYLNTYIDYKTHNIVLEQIIQTKQYAITQEEQPSFYDYYASEASHLAIATHHIFMFIQALN